MKKNQTYSTLEEAVSEVEKHFGLPLVEVGDDGLTRKTFAIMSPTGKRILQVGFTQYTMRADREWGIGSWTWNPEFDNEKPNR